MNKTIRNIIIFAVVAVSIGWIAVWLNTQIASPSPQQSLGMLLWILAPMLTGFLLRGFGGDGWADAGFKLNLRGNGFWYALSIFIYPITILVIVGIGALFGSVTFTRSFDDLPAVFLLGLAVSLVKNIGEEYAWRGYLTPQLKKLGAGNLSTHVITALVWGSWHIPYWLFFLGDNLITQYTSLGKTWFIVLGFIGLFPTSLVFGELRLKTGSVFPAYIAHNMTNALSAPLILDGFIKIKPGAELIFSPNLDGLLMMILFLGIGFWMIKKEKIGLLKG